MRVAVTGATGFLGRRLVRQLVEAGHTVVVLTHRRPADGLWAAPLETLKADVTDPGSLARAFERADAVVHLAAVLLERGGQTFERVNAQGTSNVVAAAETAGVRQLVHISVVNAHENPEYRYLWSRWEGEQAVRAGGAPWTIARASLLFGQGDEFFSVLGRMMRLPSPVFPVIGDGGARFHPFAADEFARCLLAIVDDPITAQGRVYDLGGPDVLTYDDIVETIAAVLGLRRWKLHVPVPLVRPAAWMMERLLARPLVTVEQLRLLEVDSVGAVGLVEREFGFSPTSLRDGLAYLRGKT